MSAAFTSREISAKYDRAARWYDWLEGFLDVLGLGRLRRNLLQRATGKVLEVAVGTGKNLSYYPRDCQIIALDLSSQMLKVAQDRAAKLSMPVSFSLAEAGALPFPDRSFDTVVCSLSMCTFPNPVAALEEMSRVCRPQGKVLLLEHGRSDRERLACWQDRHADQFAKPLGCHWNREPLELTKNAGLKIVRAQRSFFGILHWLETKPSAR